MIINKFCRLADKTPFITFLYFIVEYIHLATSYKLLHFSKQLHSAKLFNNQQLNLLHFILNTYHFYTFFTFIIHKIHFLRVECVNFVKSCTKMSNQNSQKKNFSGLHHPFSELVPRLPRTPSRAKAPLHINKLQHRIDLFNTNTFPKKSICQNFLPSVL